MVSKRDSRFELLRAISILMIIFAHFSFHTNWTFGPKDSVFLVSLYHAIWMGGKIGVNLFVLISGYFLINGRFKWKSLFKLWTTVYIYSILILIVAILGGIAKPNIKNIAVSIFPISFGYVSWFATAYVAMYLLSPFINTLIRHLSKRNFQSLLLILTFWFSIIRIFFHTEALGVGGNDVLWLLIIYCFGAYIKLYENDLKKIKKAPLLGILIVTIIVSWLTVFILDYLQIHYKISNNKQLSLRFLDGFSPLTLCAALLIFILILHAKPFTKKPINVMASTAFGVYLIHDNWFITDWLWNKVVDGSRYEQSYWGIVYGLLCSVIIYLVCSAIELLRQYVFDGASLQFADFMSRRKILRYLSFPKR